MSVDALLRELREDKVHGASWYFLKGIELLELALRSGFDANGIRSLLNELRSIRPGMASITTLTYVIEQALGKGFDLNIVIGKLRDRYERSYTNLANYLDRFPIMCGSRAITISYSSAVKAALTKWGKCLDMLYIMESRPGDEVMQAIKDYSSFVSRVIPIPDSSVAYFIKDVNYVVTGADGLYSDGYFLNKVGTETLMIVAHRFNVKTIVISETFKASIGGVTDVYSVNVNIGDFAVSVPLFDKVPFDLVDYLITDVGIIKKPTSEVIENLRSHFIGDVLNIGGEQ